MFLLNNTSTFQLVCNNDDLPVDKLIKAITSYKSSGAVFSVSILPGQELFKTVLEIQHPGLPVQMVPEELGSALVYIENWRDLSDENQALIRADAIERFSIVA